MRPTILDPLFVPITSLAGVGPKVGALIEKVVPADLGDRPARAGDLLFVLPHTVIDRRSRPGIAGSAEGQIVTLEVRIDRHQPPPRGNRSVPYRVFAHDDTGEIALTFFHAHASYLEKAMPEGEHVVVSGRMEWFNGRPSMVHPDHIALASEAENLPLVEPVYPLTAGLSGKVLRRAIGQALARVPEFPEWQDGAFMRRHTFAAFADALARIHNPADPIDVSIDGAAWRRLAYDELLAGQVSLALVRAKVRRLSGRPLVGDGRIVEKLRAALPYSLTSSQEFALAEINADLADPERMLRLLQGDVGSGKTVVALLAMARAVEAGGQAALMAPTEILARQHLATITPLAAKVGLRIAILTGREKGRERADTLAGLASGEIDIVVGTHALFQETVMFHDLVFAVIDEQHRFGVHQRLAITAKGDAPDMLVMTATPIPRTLVLTAFGDMDVSKLTEKPAGRQPIRTVTLPLERLDELVDRMVDAVAGGQKIYWICPLVEESEEIKLMSAEDRFASLKPLFGERIGLVHGRMKGAEKDEAMRAFKQGETRILIATTVIEVGVDVPDATVMVIEHAERFGLAQLHQLRGRVGRGDKPSSCVLLYKDPLGETAKRRLSVMRETEDGFLIAEEDLKLRGEGELLGTRQSGTPGFQVARIEAHADLLEAARDDARLILSRDPELQSQRGEALRLLLYLFGRDEAVRLLRAG
ncbi:ATP-dependent DNA helicase RecG [Mesorhizobium sp. M7A.F.Ca.CA.001.07.2.1]|uniref:ATP-dependent DNA helicase RecG n=10 Tax=Phyllobacteriaceae TaxID=69277 RepID=UPI000FCA9DEC|nr:MULTISPECIES: ATP-dependent DNA helicase RecG [Mesorhizobium]MCF6122492.1 ATP-dependent DNA helicase RecG [Mesorhizobium ciceri]MCQ8815671.1 ATP-dependent DNA helicase RecG [Mesorhizobium sp. SEMIA396]MCQ8875802.1 ATP-dependent DNA helicase RecG [Mesorhizobium sp. LMG17149]RUX79797.1 ATP-dependent DNA helicase RecG [Mesorhizobium sp. M7A.F.Ca.CA.004.08.2.1]RUX85258.1 ATP-dependent DNA helicase RecG [Mesorhizobium sp. M7A.F.Ca.CA.004.08.1.1]